MVDLHDSEQTLSRRRLVPTAREQSLGRSVDAVSFDAPVVVDDVDDAPRSPRLGRVSAYLRNLDPRLVGAPLFPMFAISLVSTLQQVELQAIGLSLPEIQTDTGVNRAALLLAISVLSYGTQLALPLMGWLADRRSRVVLMRIGALLAAAGNALFAFGGSVGTLALGRLGAASGDTVSRPAGYTLLADHYPVLARIRIVFFLFTIGGICNVIVIGTAGFAIGALGWRPVFLGLGVVYVLGALLLTRVREVPRGYWERKDLGASEEVARTEQAPLSWKESWRAAASIGLVRRQWIAAPLFGVVNLFVNLFVGTYFAQRYGLTPSERTVIAVINASAVLFGLLFIGQPLARLITTRPRLVIGLQASQGVLTTLGFGALLIAPNLFVSIVIVALMAMVSGTIFPLQLGLLSLVIPPRLRGFGMQTLYFWSVPAAVIFAVIGGQSATRGLGQTLLFMAPFGLAASLVLLTAMPLVERDIRAGLQASLADEEARQARASGRNKMLICRGVDVAYSGVQVLFGVDLDVEEGEIVALLGTNGAGKSTLLRAIAGIQEASGGAIFLDGRDITHVPPHENAASGVVVVPGGHAVCAALTVEENLRTAAWLHRKDDAYVSERMEAALVLFPALAPRLRSQAGDLSGGEQQMLAIAQSYLMDPRLLMIDELSLGLAPQVVETLLDSLRAINAAGTTILLVEQSLNVALTIARRAVFMDKGEVRFDGSTEDLLQRPDLVRAVFMGSVSGTRRTARRRASSADGESEQLLEVDGLSVRFGGIDALTDVSLTVRPREVVGIIGPNGAGKTTLFDAISGLTPAQAGRVLIKGSDVSAMTLDGRAAAGLGRSFQNARLFPSMTVRENIAVGLHRHVKTRNPLLAAVWAPMVRSAERAARDRVDDVIELLGLQAYADKFVGELSTGTRRAVDVGAIMMASADVLLLDEPSSGLAQAESEALGPLILRLVRETGCGVLVIEHDLPLVTGIADRMIAMELGRVIATGTPDEVMRDPEVRRSYLSASKEVLLRSGSVIGDALAAAGLDQAAPSTTTSSSTPERI